MNQDKQDKQDNKDSKITHLPMVDLQISEVIHSPIMKLPPEIISSIFNFTLPYLSTPHSLSKKDQQFILGAVCKDWRAIAWSTPILWSSMAVRFSKYTLNNRRITLVKDWLARSGQLPLSIHIFFRSFTLSPVRTADLTSLAEIINQYSSRWCHFELTSKSEIATFFRAEEYHAPILESLRLHLSDERGKFDLVTCPQLQKVHLVSVPLSIINFSMSNVTHICLQMFFIDCLEILRNTPLLVHAELIGKLSAGVRPLLSHRIIIPVKSLKVVGYAYDFFPYITCPALDELVCDVRGANTILSCIIRFLEGSGRLRSFSMLNFIAFSQFRSLLRAIPSVNKLVLQIVPLKFLSKITSQQILDVLEMTQCSKSNFLPHLETFDYTGPPFLPIPNIISPDLSPPTDNAVQGPLKSVKIDFYSAIHIPDSAISFFMRLRERGVTVNISSASQDILQPSIDYYKDSLRWDWFGELDLSPMQDPS